MEPAWRQSSGAGAGGPAARSSGRVHSAAACADMGAAHVAPAHTCAHRTPDLVLRHLAEGGHRVILVTVTTL